jgi:hypothetical protein
VTLFDVVNGLEVRKLMPPAAFSSASLPPTVTFAPDSRSLLKFDGELRVIEMATLGERIRLPREPAGSLSTLAWSDNGRLVARAQSDGLVTVFDIVQGRELFRRFTGQGIVHSLAISRDGRKLATGGANTTILVWDLPESSTMRSTLADETAWRDLEEFDAERAFRAITHLASQPTETIRLFKDRLKTRPPVDPKRIDQLIKDLDDDSYAVREKAGEELAEIGALAEEALKIAVKNSSFEVKRRSEDLLRKIKGGSSLAPDRLREQRAVEVLECIGTPEARKMLRKVLEGKLDSTLERAIKGSLERLGESS